MRFAVDREEGLPLYLQVVRQIEQMIAAGLWEAGTQLPPERELARALGVSRNTISMAYKRLESEGVLVSRQGRGTFVAARGEVSQRPRGRKRLERLLDLAIEEALYFGYSLEQFVELARAKAEEKRELLRRVRVAFVECNREQLDYFSRELELGSGVSIIPVLLDELRAGHQHAQQALREADLIVTTFFHLQEVERLIPDPGQELLGIALDPDMETIVRIARLPQGTRVGLVCLSWAFADRVRQSIRNAGITGLELLATVERDRERLREFLRDVDAVIASPGRRREVEEMLSRDDVEVIEFIYRPDAGSVNLLRSVLLESRSKPLFRGVITLGRSK